MTWRIATLAWKGDEAQSAMPGKTINILWATQPPRSGAAIAPDHR
jgi:hypothetical protein